jgi:hypothetical protein
MKYRLVTVAGTLLGLFAAAHGQVPHIIGTWKLNIEASQFLGPAPRSEVRRYDVADDGYLVGLAVFVDAQGNPGFLQFAAKSDGQDYAEYSSGVLAAFQIAGTPTPLAYSEKPVDERTVEWFDKFNGRVSAFGTKQISEDGRTLTIVGEVPDPQGNTRRLRLVYDKQ